MFFAIAAIVLGGVFAYYYEGDFVSTVRPAFFVSAFSVLFVSSLLYTPFSFGLSYYFLRSKTDSATFSDIFYLFKKPRLLFRAIISDSLRRFVISLIRLLILALAALLELALLVFCPRGSSLFILLHILAWSIVLFLLFLVKIRFILCKYVLISRPDTSAVRSFVIGTAACRGKTVLVLRFYIKYLAVYIFTFITLGLTRALRAGKTRDSFCTFAVSLVDNC